VLRKDTNVCSFFPSLPSLCTHLARTDFGFLDGFGQPFVEGFATDVQPGFSVIPPGVLLLGEKGDPLAKKRPAWAKDGSFFVFRQLQEMVPEFNRFLKENAIQDPTGRVNLTQEEGAEMLGARFFGRWKSVRLPSFSLGHSSLITILSRF
jgi:deferrochelatase/peroxidase EfeB